MRMIWVALVVGFLVMGAVPHAWAKKNPSASCRSSIGKSVQKAVIAGLKIMGRCHTKRLKGASTGDCNSLANIDFDRAQAQALARMKIACKDGDPVVQNYHAATIAAGFPPYFEAIQGALEKTGTELLGLPLFQGDKQTVKPLQKCHGAVGAGQMLVVAGALKSAVKCQTRIDKSAQTFGPIDPSCLVGAGSAGGKASSKIGKGCGSLSGVVVGSCPTLPGCVVA